MQLKEMNPGTYYRKSRGYENGSGMKQSGTEIWALLLNCTPSPV